MLPTDLMLAIILTWSFSEGRTIYKEVLINATTKISCSPNEDIQLQLHHTPLHGPEKYVYTMGIIRYSSSRGVSMEKDSNTGPYHLVIPHARTEDAGLYKCQEDNSSRVFDSTQLTVLESIPVCESNMKDDGYVGPTTCQLTEEDMTFTCAVSFSGELPQMTWKILNGWEPFNKSMCKTENGRITCSLIIKAESKYDGSIFNCQSTKSSAECSTKVIKIQYFESQLVDRKPPVLEKNMGDKVNCSVKLKSNRYLTFKWTVFDGVRHVFRVKDEELSITSPGLYRCIVEYSIRNVQCDALVIEVNANVTYCPPQKAVTPAPTTTAATTTPAITVLAILVVICISAIYRM